MGDKRKEPTSVGKSIKLSTDAFFYPALRDSPKRSYPRASGIFYERR
jgi:hypothetical protein